MAYEKLKREEYFNIGGINRKASVYITGEREVLDLVNLDLSTPGAWTQRPGMTNAIAGNTLAIGSSNRYNFGFQTISAYQASFSYNTYVVTQNQIYALSLGNGVLTSRGSTLVSTSGAGNAVLSFTDSESSAFMAVGNTPLKENRRTFIENGPWYSGYPRLPATITTGSSGTGSLTGAYFFKFAYSNNLKTYGPASPAAASLLTYGVSVSVAGVSLIQFQGLTLSQQAVNSGANYIMIFGNRVKGFPSDTMALVGQVVSSATVFNLLAAASSSGALSPVPLDLNYPDNVLEIEDVISNADDSINNTDAILNTAIAVEKHQNRLFWLQNLPKNQVLFTEIIETTFDEEKIYPENNFLLQNQQFSAVGLKSFNQALFIFNQLGVSRLTGDNPNNFNLQELTREYGLTSSRAIAIWHNHLWFLDEHGIIEFNGANFMSVSNRVDDYIRRMNVTAARNAAVAIHYESRNEVWFAIPIDGSNENNIVLIYDYLADGWYTTKSSYAFTMLQDFYQPITTNGVPLLTNQTFYTGSPGGSMTYFGDSFASDNGAGITVSFKSRYHSEQGHSTTNIWRRLYLDTGPWAGVTIAFQANFYTNFATNTIALTRSIYASGSQYSGQQQTRIDFGLPAKSMSVEIVYGATNLKTRIYGYSVESRFLRRV